VKVVKVVEVVDESPIVLSVELRETVDTKVLDSEEGNVDGIDVVELIDECEVPASKELTEV
jgi:hypothetical protein